MKSPKRRLVVRIVFWSLVLFALVLLLQKRGVIRFIPRSQIVGVYFRMDTPSLIEISSDGTGGLMLSQIWPPAPFNPWEIETRWRTMVLEMEMSIPMPQSGEFELEYEYHYKPSANAGDWDLVANRDTPEYDSTGDGSSIRKPMYLNKLDKPVVSCLHRIDGGPWKEYFAGVASYAVDYSGKSQVVPVSSAEMFALAEEILEGRPDDPLARCVYLDALIRNKQHDELVERYTEWKPEFPGDLNSFYNDCMKAVESAIRANQLTVQGENADETIERLYRLTTSLEDRYLILAELLQYDVWEPGNTGLFWTNQYHFLNYQVFAKVVTIEVIYSLMRGDANRALRLAASSYRIGQLLLAQDSMIAIMVGNAVCGISSTGLRHIVLGGNEDIVQLEEVRESLEALQSANKTFSTSQLLKYYDSDTAFDEAKIREYAEERRIQSDTVGAQFQLLRGAAAARYSLLTNGAPTPSIASLDTLFDSDPPRDPFTGDLLQYKFTQNDMTLWSLGPDKEDNSAAITYDPTNGTVSAGDLILEVPEIPRYSFPRTGIDLSSEASITRAFPDGLPPDGFADTRGRPLTVHPGNPPIIFSVGPDIDQYEYTKALQAGGGPLDEYLSQPQYDPTNGILSRGNLYFAPPK